MDIGHAHIWCISTWQMVLKKDSILLYPLEREATMTLTLSNDDGDDRRNQGEGDKDGVVILLLLHIIASSSSFLMGSRTWRVTSFFSSVEGKKD